MDREKPSCFFYGKDKLWKTVVIDKQKKHHIKDTNGHLSLENYIEYATVIPVSES